MDGNSSRQAKIVESESLLWGNAVGDAYHQAAQRDMDQHWTSIIEPELQTLQPDFTHTADFACGRGRNTQKLRAHSSRLTLIDVNAENIAYCKDRFSPDPQVDYFICTGFGLTGLPDNTFSFYYSFDSMVHFDVELIAAYMPEFARVIRPGGTAFLHHSNYSDAPGRDFRSNPHWRNFMSAGLFAHLAERSGLRVLSQQPLAWGGMAAIDCITTCRREA